MRDNWEHRRHRMRCGTCMWFVAKPRPESTCSEPVVAEPGPCEGPEDTTPVPFGRCRRHAPTLAGWPAVYGTDWCGDHKLDEAFT